MRHWAIATRNREFWVRTPDGMNLGEWAQQHSWSFDEALEGDLEDGPVPVRNLWVEHGQVEAYWELIGAPLTSAKDGFARMAREKP